MREYSTRVYFQDTDAGGVLHHAAAINLLERARSEWLRGKGFGQAELIAQTQTVFVVRELSVEYLAPAALDELVTIRTRVLGHSRASARVEQTIARGDKNLIIARVLLVCVDAKTFKPTAIPPALLPLDDGE